MSRKGSKSCSYDHVLVETFGWIANNSVNTTQKNNALKISENRMKILSPSIPLDYIDSEMFHLIDDITKADKADKQAKEHSVRLCRK